MGGEVIGIMPPLRKRKLMMLRCGSVGVSLMTKFAGKPLQEATVSRNRVGIFFFM